MIKFLLGFLLVSTLAFADANVNVNPLKISVVSSNVTATNSAAPIPTSAMVGRSSVAICNNSASTVTAYIGSSTVTALNGLPLSSSNPCISLDVNSSVALYAITASSTADLRILEAK